MKCTRIGEKRCNRSSFEIDQEMDDILLIIDIMQLTLLVTGKNE
jgi:hypothetical protein